ncbi:hypothetical protein NESM_000857400 [Novymonas esmeraldas]|uniref:Uncharacterized protein n=1 Tax=Novymonas esmeraldas TaxID=1808958 RepID=A0AAW0EXQ0_9TRYP
MSATAAVPRRFAVPLDNLGCVLETVDGVTYPHHIFGSNMALRSDGGELLLPGVDGEVRLEEGRRYTVDHVKPR